MIYVVRAVVAILAAVLGWLAMPTAMAVASAEGAIVAYSYDIPTYEAPNSYTAPERGPPTNSPAHPTYDAVGDRSHRASERSGAPLGPSVTTYSDPARHVQAVRATATTGAQVGAPDDHRCEVAAKYGDELADACRTNSFTGETLVLMADGTRMPISDVELGDWVMDTDPISGGRGPRKVVDLIRHSGLHTMVAIQLADGTTIDATDRHPFWVESQGDWVDAIDLKPGDVVVTADGDSLVVESVGVSEQDLRAFNLTVAGVHTYHVSASEVLVHNCIRNSHLAGSTHPKSDVPFDKNGFPDFSAFRHTDVPDVRIQLTGSRSQDFRLANEAAGLARTPSGYTWHHHQDVGLMQLIRSDIHRMTGHTGGFSLR